MKSLFQSILWLVKKSIFGFVAFYAFNLIGTFIGLHLVSNYFSYFLIGTLGIPGLMLVYIGNLIFV